LGESDELIKLHKATEGAILFAPKLGEFSAKEIIVALLKQESICWYLVSPLGVTEGMPSLF
jgi:hypothetical protein